MIFLETLNVESNSVNAINLKVLEFKYQGTVYKNTLVRQCETHIPFQASETRDRFVPRSGTSDPSVSCNVDASKSLGN